MMLEPLGEVGANFSLQFSSRTQFTKINNKKVIAENQCEKHKKSSLNNDLIIWQVSMAYVTCVQTKLMHYKCLAHWNIVIKGGITVHVMK